MNRMLLKLLGPVVLAVAFFAVRGDLPDGLPTFADGLRAASLTEAVLQSARTGAWVEPTRPQQGEVAAATGPGRSTETP